MSSIPGSLGPYLFVNGAGQRFDVVLSLAGRREYDAAPPWGGTPERCLGGLWQQRIEQDDEVYLIGIGAYWNRATPDELVLPALNYLMRAAAAYYCGVRPPDARRTTPIVWPLNSALVEQSLTADTVTLNLPGMCSVIGLLANTEARAFDTFAKWYPSYA